MENGTQHFTTLLMPIIVIAGILGAVEVYYEMVYLPSPITVKATIEDYTLRPQEIKARAGSHLVITVSSLDRDYWFNIDDYGVRELVSKNPTNIEIHLDKPGHFHVECQPVGENTPKKDCGGLDVAKREGELGDHQH